MSAADLVGADGATEVGTRRLCRRRGDANRPDQDPGRQHRGHRENAHRRVDLPARTAPAPSPPEYRGPIATDDK